MKAAMADAAPGLDALTKGLEACGRWSVANRALSQLMFSRPVPSFEPSAETFRMQPWWFVILWKPPPPDRTGQLKPK